MRYNRKEIDEWIKTDLVPRYPELVKPLRKALNAYERILKNGHITSRDLSAIVECIRSKRTWLLEVTADLLANLTFRYQEARDAVVDLSNDKQSRVRFNAILCLARRTPLRLTLDILSKSLKDKSASVRNKAADWALRLNFIPLIADLEEALSKERNKNAKETIIFSISLLRDGYILDEPDVDGTMSITVLHECGLACDSTTAEEIRKKGIKRVIGAIKRRHR